MKKLLSIVLLTLTMGSNVTAKVASNEQQGRNNSLNKAQATNKAQEKGETVGYKAITIDLLTQEQL